MTDKTEKLLAQFDQWGRSGGGTGVKDAANLAATVKRTSSAIQSIQSSHARVILSEHETAALDEAMRVLARLGSEVQAVKKQVKKANEEWTSRRARLLAEASVAVGHNFPPTDVMGSVVLLAWGQGTARLYFGSSWRTLIREEFEPRANSRHQPDVMAEINRHHDELAREMVHNIVTRTAGDGKLTVAEIVAEFAADLESKRAGLAEKNRAFIDQIKTVAVAQRLAKSAN